MKGFNGNTKLLLLQPSLHKPPAGPSAPSLATFASHHRLYILAFLSIFTLASLLTLFTSIPTKSVPFNTTAHNPHTSPLPNHVFHSLLHYAISSNSTGKMDEPDLRYIASLLRRRGPCDLLVFGMGPETPLWQALNAGGRTVFLDENEYYVAFLEKRHPGLEAYEVAYTTKVSDLHSLVASARAAVGVDCRPLQNLLFSDCRLAINDLPNSLYDVAWDVILVDGPRGYSPASPGRMSAIFTAAVMARWRNAGPTDVLVHDYGREAERVCGEEFLCRENRVATVGQLAHFLIRGGAARRGGGFCDNRSMAAATARSTVTNL